MPKVLLTEAARRAERERKADEAFRGRMGEYMAVTGRSLTDLAMAIGVSPRTMYNWYREPGKFRLSEYRRITEVLDQVSSDSR